MTIDLLRLGKLFTALYNPSEGERNSAASRLYQWMLDNRVHPDEVVVDVKGEREARFDRLMKRFEEENTKLRRTNDFFVAHADAKLTAKAQQAGLIENRWDEFAALLCERFGVKALPAKGWQEPVLAVVGISPSQLQNWRNGLAKIPETAFDKVRMVRTLQITRRRRRAKPNGKDTRPQSELTL